MPSLEDADLRLVLVNQHRVDATLPVALGVLDVAVVTEPCKARLGCVHVQVPAPVPGDGRSVGEANPSPPLGVAVEGAADGKVVRGHEAVSDVLPQPLPDADVRGD